MVYSNEGGGEIDQKAKDPELNFADNIRKVGLVYHVSRWVKPKERVDWGI